MGKEPGQAVGYLDDGTMVVVDNAKNLIGSHVNLESAYCKHFRKNCFC